MWNALCGINLNLLAEFSVEVYPCCLGCSQGQQGHLTRISTRAAPEREEPLEGHVACGNNLLQHEAWLKPYLRLLRLCPFFV